MLTEAEIKTLEQASKRLSDPELPYQEIMSLRVCVKRLCEDLRIYQKALRQSVDQCISWETGFVEHDTDPIVTHWLKEAQKE